MAHAETHLHISGAGRAPTAQDWVGRVLAWLGGAAPRNLSAKQLAALGEAERSRRALHRERIERQFFLDTHWI